MLFPCHWCGKDVEVNYKYGYKYCFDTDCRKLAKAERLKIRKAELARLRQQRNNETFLVFIKDNPKFIADFIYNASNLKRLYAHKIRFQSAFDTIRELDYHLRNAWKIPCKQYLKEHEPDSLQYFKDVN